MTETLEQAQIRDFRIIPKRKISEAEKQIINLRIERMKLEREKVLLILGAALLLFVGFIAIGVVGLLNKFISGTQLNLMVLIGFGVLIVGILPYISFVMKEVKSLQKTLDELTN